MYLLLTIYYTSCMGYVLFLQQKSDTPFLLFRRSCSALCSVCCGGISSNCCRYRHTPRRRRSGQGRRRRKNRHVRNRFHGGRLLVCTVIQIMFVMYFIITIWVYSPFRPFICPYSIYFCFSSFMFSDFQTISKMFF